MPSPNSYGSSVIDEHACLPLSRSEFQTTTVGRNSPVVFALWSHPIDPNVNCYSYWWKERWHGMGSTQQIEGAIPLILLWEQPLLHNTLCCTYIKGNEVTTDAEMEQI